MIQIRTSILVLLGFVMAVLSSCATALKPAEALPLMQTGINIGNTMELDANGPIQPYYFDDYKEQGFTSVRIPINWGNHSMDTPPYTIDEDWLSTVEQVVDWGLERDLFIIINGHHEEWIKKSYNSNNKARYLAIWEQISERLQDRSDRLLFEIINEPYGMTQEDIDDLNFSTLEVIRETNPKRIVIYSGKGWSAANDLLEAKIPKDKYLMGYFHTYYPWSFAGEAKGTWGHHERKGLFDIFKTVSQWSEETGIPVLLSEFGAVRAADYNSRMFLYQSYAEGSHDYNLGYMVWDDGGMFKIYEREDRQWPPVADVLTKIDRRSPINVRTVEENGAVKITWEHRSEDNIQITIDKRVGSGEFKQVDLLQPDATEYIDAKTIRGVPSYYKINAVFEDGKAPSYPVRMMLPHLERQPFQDSPLAIPGIIEAEFFDIGAPGESYFDQGPGNTTEAFRPYTDVDIEERKDGGYQVAYIDAGEWLEYTVNIAEAGTYVIEAEVASMDGGGQFKVSLGDTETEVYEVPATGGWQANTILTQELELPAGTHFLRISMIKADPFNVDRLIIKKK